MWSYCERPLIKLQAGAAQLLSIVMNTNII